MDNDYNIGTHLAELASNHTYLELRYAWDGFGREDHPWQARVLGKRGSGTPQVVMQATANTAEDAVKLLQTKLDMEEGIDVID